MSKRSNSSINLGERLLECLKNSPNWAAKTRITGTTIQGLICPECGEPEAWAYTNWPMAIMCNRGKECAVKTNTLELFPEVRRNIEKDFPATKEDPHRPAIEYLRSRGLLHVLTGLEPRYMKNVRNTGSGAVMFFIGKDASGKDVLNGRLFNPPQGGGKTHNIGSTSGLFWQHPSMAYDPYQKTYITEGIIDALSLLEIGKQAIAVLASGQDPGKVDLSQFTNKVLSFDNDEAGHRACRKWKKVYPTAEVNLCDPGQDWNDLLSSETLEFAKKQFEDKLTTYYNNGELALAETANQYADIFHKFYTYLPGLFTFKKSTYLATLKAPRGSDQPAYVDVTCCLKATIKVISYIIDRSNPARPEYRYNLEVKPHQQGRRAVEVMATGKDLSSSRSLNEFFLTSAKINWEGDAKAATAMQSKITGDKAAPEVCQLTVTGYQPENGAYVFHKWAIDSGGKLIIPNKRGHFQIGHNLHFRPPAHSESKAITPATITKERTKEIYQLIRNSWGLNGVVALSWVISGWFVNQIKEETNFFPFLSLHGDPASGKSALVILLNNIQGRIGEGLPVNQLNSKKGSIRTIVQLSGLFTALLEDNERAEKSFDYSITLTAYNRGPLQVQATFSNDLQTRESPFLGSLLFCQNTEPFNSKAEKQRVISLLFKADHITDASRSAYESLMSIEKSELAGILQQVLLNKAHFKEWHKEYKAAGTALCGIDERRIRDNHALTLAFYRLFCSCFGIEEDAAVTKFLDEIGRLKCVTSATRQTDIADHFFDLLNMIDVRKNEQDTCDKKGREKPGDAYHADTKKGMLFVNLPKVEKLLKDRGINLQVNSQFLTALDIHPAHTKIRSMQYRFPYDPDMDSSGRRAKQRRVWSFWLKWFDDATARSLPGNQGEEPNE